MKNKLTNIFLVLAVSLIFGQTSFCQDSELVKLYKELSDEYFFLKEYSDSSLSVFSADYRNYYLNKKYYNQEDDDYEVNIYLDSEGYYDNEIVKLDADSADLYSDPTFTEIHSTLKIFETSGVVKYRYFYEGQEKLLFLILHKTDTEKFLLILEQDIPGMGVPKRFSYKAYKLNADNRIMESVPLNFPEFKWEDYYSKKEIRKIKQKQMTDVSVEYIVNVDIVENKACLCFSPDLNELFWRKAEMLQLEQNFDQGTYDAYLKAEELMGFKKVGLAREKVVFVGDLVK